jgi:hypothetical protein
MSEEVPKDLKGFKLEKEGGMGLIKKVILIIVIALALMYFFKPEWFDMVVSFVTGLFGK